jgi:hypothetical protein
MGLEIPLSFFLSTFSTSFFSFAYLSFSSFYMALIIEHKKTTTILVAKLSPTLPSPLKFQRPCE